MFTGIVESIGTIAKLTQENECARMDVTIPGFAQELEIGESVAVNGCCLSVVARTQTSASFDILGQTLRVTNLGNLQQGEHVNLERALRPASRISGHFVQGHIDTVSEIVALDPAGQDHRLEVTIPPDFSRYLAPKGSIAVDGISLTAAEIDDEKHTFTCWITPHTQSVTNLANRRAGHVVNLEFDMLAKHLERLVTPQASL